MSCGCRCHAYGPGTHIECDPAHDQHSSGVPGKPSCSPCDGNRPAEAQLNDGDGACNNGCTDREGRPTRATHGRLCGRCARRLDEMLRDIAIDYALLPLVMTPGSAPTTGGGGHTKRAEAPVPIRLDVIAITDTDRNGLQPRARGDELWYEAPDVPKALATISAWAQQLRDDLAEGP